MVLYSLSFYSHLLLLIIPLVLLLLKKKAELNKQLLPGPLKLPIVGNLHQIGNLPHQSLWQLSKKYGPVMLIHLGRMPTLAVSSAEAAKEVLKTRDLDCCSRPRLADTKKLIYNYLDIAFSPYSDNWREMRKICLLELFSFKRIQSFKFIREEVNSLMNFISQLSLSATPVNLSEKSYALTASIVFRMASGTTFQGSGFDNGRLQELIHELRLLQDAFLQENTLHMLVGL